MVLVMGRVPGAVAPALVLVEDLAIGREVRVMRNRRMLALVLVTVIAGAGCDVVRVSLSSAGTEANGPSGGVSLAGDASSTVFESDASNLVPGDTNGVRDVLVRDTKSNTTSLVSVGRDGGPADGFSSEAVTSGDGRFVAFWSAATNLVSGAPASGFYLRDLRRGITRLVSKSPEGLPIQVVFSDQLAISSTGRFVVFLGDFKVYRYDRYAGSAVQVLDFPRRPTAVSDDGRYLATDTTVLIGVHSLVGVVFDLATGQSIFSGPSDSWGIRITPDAEYAVYAFAPNCFPSQFPSCTAGASGVRLRHLKTGTEYPVLTTLGLPFAQVTGLGVSRDAQRVALATADNAYLFDRPTGAFTLVSLATNRLETGNAPSGDATISADGTTVGFSSAASNLVDEDTNGVEDVFTRRL